MSNNKSTCAKRLSPKATAGNHPKTLYTVNTVYVMKQGKHIQFQLVTMKRLKNTVNYFMLFLKTCLLVTLDSIDSLQKQGDYGFVLLTGERVHFFFSNPENKPMKKKVYIQAVILNMLAKTEGGPAGCHSSLILQPSIPIQIARPPHARERSSHWAGEELC